ncbi:hypothetical protein GCM10012320_13640 [Sinomonas cellulolyticus]|uniref:Co/Zn/Cd efflux system component n=1 Tax=Sinomonas cellulolyticus TaxID=2801916 RepID=A0ABS1JZV9_9MICC|nr:MULTISPECIES: hypothetical protein [Sinomonas]MBL0704799.1 hypothetical protein [Sinomonas cellulolyticus]GHG47134.1 hypothetical protein GCM10012320_13640 [Sinomonas sp. KCTC 49339]
MALARRARRALTVLVALALASVGVYIAALVLNRSDKPIVEGCTAPLGSATQQLATDQAANASLITAIAVRRGLPPRAATIALATAMQESKLRNISYGHADSLGLFQQRPSQGWGTQAQIMDPVFATNAFYDGLVKIPGYESLPITDAAQEVQRSGYPQAYAQHEDMGRAFASALTGQSQAALTCTLRPPDAAGDPEEVRSELTRAYGAMQATAAGKTLAVPASGATGWSIAQWAVANAKQLAITKVDFSGHTWLRDGNKGWTDSAAPDGTVTITVAPTP